jgi:hypothetical protein
MSIGSFLLGFALLIVIGLFLARPFLSPETKKDRLSRRQALLADKEVFLEQIQSLDFDYETGKMPEDVYQSQRAYLLTEAAAVMKKLDDMSSLPELAAPDQRVVPMDDDIEAVIARYRRSASPAKATNGRAGFCTQCGQPRDVGDKFCAKCGQKLPA